MHHAYRTLAALVCVLSGATAQAQLAGAYQTSLNRYTVSFTPTYALDFESGASQIVAGTPSNGVTLPMQ